MAFFQRARPGVDWLLVVVLGTLLLGATDAMGQTMHVIEGIVKDPTGAAVPGSRVEARGEGIPKSSVTDASGRFRIHGLVAGRHVVRAELYGFLPAVANVELTSPTTTVELTLGAVVSSESVTVTASTSGHQFDVMTPSASRLGLTPRETPRPPSMSSRSSKRRNVVCGRRSKR